jgi:hypothetical protein
MKPLPDANENTTRFEKRLATLAGDNIDFAVAGGVRIPFLSPQDLIFPKQNSSREKDKLDVAAMKEMIASEKKKS